jgi:hypothetical protein
MAVNFLLARRWIFYGLSRGCGLRRNQNQIMCPPLGSAVDGDSGVGPMGCESMAQGHGPY